MLHAALISLVLAGATAAQVAVIPFQRTQALSPDDALLLQEVISGLVEESPRFQLFQVSLEDLMAGRVPQFVIAGSLRRTNGGAYELELNLQVKGQTLPISSTVRQGPDLPALAAALEDVLPSLFGEGASPNKPREPAQSTAASQQAPATSVSKKRFFRRAWQAYAALGGVALGATGGALWWVSDEGLDALRAEYDAEADPPRKEQRRQGYNAAIDRQIQGRFIAAAVMITGAVSVVAGLIP